MDAPQSTTKDKTSPSEQYPQLLVSMGQEKKQKYVMEEKANLEPVNCHRENKKMHADIESVPLSMKKVQMTCSVLVSRQNKFWTNYT
ncbi:hypothetical protein GDO81_008284 [Engystomops pustulosus]|uniref:Prolactin receptor n=1 Tax=Engystomops pustulosus TaxID=76066 RepID=A0AAV7CDK4_ENGPU|nr:hypothetical protein GDO81_008284 [Engystomops pustulosus]